MIKLPQRETKLLVAVHGWSGVLLGLLLFAVIVTGTAAVFTHEITAWSGGSTGLSDPFNRPINRLAQTLSAKAPETYRGDMSIRRTDTGHLTFFFHKDAINPSGAGDAIGVMYYVDGNDQVSSRREGWISALSAEDPETALGRFLVDLHVRLHLPNPYGLILTGVLGLAMLVAAISGLLIHRHLFTDIFTLRSRNRIVGVRDAHTVAATWTLPHAFVLAFTGAFFSFALSVGVPLMAHVAFNGDQPAMIETLVGKLQSPNAAPAGLASLDEPLADSRARAGTPIVSAVVENIGRADAQVAVAHEARDGDLNGVTFVYNASTGVFLGQKPALGTKPSIGSSALGLMGPLHFGTFAGWWSKAVWFALGATTAYVTWSGLSLWMRRRADNPNWRILDRLARWFCGGLPFSIAVSAAAFFLTLPAGQSHIWTPIGFLTGAAMSFVAATTIRRQKVIDWLLAATGVILLALPLLRLYSGGPSWMDAIESSATTIVTVDLLVLTGAVTCFAPLVRRLRTRVQWRPSPEAAE